MTVQVCDSMKQLSLSEPIKNIFKFKAMLNVTIFMIKIYRTYAEIIVKCPQ